MTQKQTNGRKKFRPTNNLFLVDMLVKPESSSLENAPK